MPSFDGLFADSANSIPFGSIVTSLDLSSNDLCNLQGIEQFPNLESLILDYNEFGNEAFTALSKTPTASRIETLWLNNNGVSDLRRFVEDMKEFKNLGYLTMLQNPCCPNKALPDEKDAHKQYRDFVIRELAPISLHTLDAKLISIKDKARLAASSPIDPPPVDESILKQRKHRGPAHVAVAKEGELTLLRVGNNGMTEAQLAVHVKTRIAWEPLWFVASEQRLIWYADWKQINPMDILHLRGSYSLHKGLGREDLDQALKESHLFGLRLDLVKRSQGTDRPLEEHTDELYLLAQTQADIEQWEHVLNKQCSISSNSAVVSEFTRLQDERKQQLQDEEDSRIEEVQKRFAKLPVERFDPQEVRLIRLIGIGAFGTVYQALVRQKTVAVKVLHLHDNNARVLEDFVNECEILSKLRHPNILALWGVCFEPKMIITELMKGNLSSLLSDQHKDLSLVSRLRLAKDIGLGLSYLHGLDNMIIHRDIKPPNFLIDENLRVVVADFGVSEILKRGASTWDEIGSFKGTLIYSAPELLRGDVFDERSDVYSFALVLWSIFTREDLWTVIVREQAMSDFVNRVLFKHWRPPLPAETPSSLVELLESCWMLASSERPSMAEVVSKLNDIMLEQAIPFDPTGRAFWNTHFCGRDKVELDDVFGYVSRYFKPKSLSEESLLKYLFTEGSIDQTVAIERFGRIMKWFGPLQAPGTVQRIVEVTSQPWFFGFLSAEEAIRLLSGQPIGTFVIRFCQSRSNGAFYVIYVDAEAVKHVVINRFVSDSPWRESFTVAAPRIPTSRVKAVIPSPPLGKRPIGRSFPSLRALISQLQSDSSVIGLKLGPHMPVATPFSCFGLFQPN